MDDLRGAPGIVDETTGAVSFLADVPQGSRAQVAMVNRDGILEDCEASVAAAFDPFSRERTLPPVARNAPFLQKRDAFR